MSEIILFRGRPGVGKTTLTNQLSLELNVPIIRKDDFYDIVAGFNESHEQRNKISYGILSRFLETNMNIGARYILDFPFNQESDMTRFKDWSMQRGYILKPILCTCSDERVWAERFNRRKANPLPNQLITDFDELKKHYADLRIKPIDGELVIDTIEPLEMILKKVHAYININLPHLT